MVHLKKGGGRAKFFRGLRRNTQGKGPSVQDRGETNFQIAFVPPAMGFSGPGLVRLFSPRLLAARKKEKDKLPRHMKKLFNKIAVFQSPEDGIGKTEVVAPKGSSRFGEAAGTRAALDFPVGNGGPTPSNWSCETYVKGKPEKDEWNGPRGRWEQNCGLLTANLPRAPLGPSRRSGNHRRSGIWGGVELLGSPSRHGSFFGAIRNNHIGRCRAYSLDRELKTSA